jgi:hypothetical protein
MIIALISLFFGTEAMAQSQTEDIQTAGDSIVVSTMESDSIVADSIYRNIINSPIMAIDSSAVASPKPKKIW